MSTLRRLSHLCDTGGVVAAQAALAQMALAAGLYAGPVPGSKALPTMGAWAPDPAATDDGAVHLFAEAVFPSCPSLSKSWCVGREWGWGC